MQRIKNKIKKLPDAPGVYFFLRAPKPSEGGKPKILYIGKATSLRDRVRSYMSRSVLDTRGPLIEKMLSEFTDIKFQKTDSVLEALILEAALIKKHQPPANTDAKDDKSFNYVVITDDPPASQARALRAGDFPRVLIVRGRELENKFPYKILHKFGPFTNGGQLKEAMKIVRKIFPFRDRCSPHPALSRRPLLGKERERERTKPCFNRQIGLCPGVCTGEISKKDYGKIIKNIILFFEGKKKQIVKKLEKQMHDFAKARKFEKAAQIKKTLFALNHTQDVALIKESSVSRSVLDTKTNFRIESYDIAHLSGTNMVGAMVVVENGEAKKSDYRKFKIREQKGADDTKALAEVLTRRLNHTEWPLPNLIVVDGGVAQKRVVEKVLNNQRFKIPVVSVVKDERHKPKEKLEKDILLANAEAHRFAISFHKKLRAKLP